MFEIYEYQFKVKGIHFVQCFYAREDNVADEMKRLFEKGMGCELTLKKKVKIYIQQPPYEKEQEQLEILRKGNEK